MFVGCCSTEELTPVERHGSVWLKRDDLFRVAGANGGKARVCWLLARCAASGLVASCSRVSTLLLIVPRIARALDLPCRVHVPCGCVTPEMEVAVRYGAELVQHKCGYSTVLAYRARQDASQRGWTNIPFCLETPVAVQCARAQAANVPEGVRRVVVVVGSGMTVCGILWGLRDRGLAVPVLGVQVGGGQGTALRRRLERFAPADWSRRLRLVSAAVPYRRCLERGWDGVVLDGRYEAKAVDFLEEGDLFWIVGCRTALSEEAGCE